jgi:hypothetical protein
MVSTTIFLAKTVDTAYTCMYCESWIKANTRDWDLADWESTYPGEIGYWKNGKWYPQA